jgi:hypothetical protein
MFAAHLPAVAVVVADDAWMARAKVPAQNEMKYREQAKLILQWVEQHRRSFLLHYAVSDCAT